jgi:transposase
LRPAAWIGSSGLTGSPGRLARSTQDADVRVMRAQVRRIKELTREANALERELLLLVRGLQPRLLALPGVGPLTAAKLIAEIAGIERLRSHAKLARLAGVAPIPASSGNRTRVRLHRAGNRQLNAAFSPHRRHPDAHAPTRPGLHRPPT